MSIFKNLKVFVVSNATLDYKEVKLFKTKVALFATAVGLFSIGMVYGANYLSGGLLGFGVDRITMITTENHVLKEQVKELSQKIKRSQVGLDQLVERGNQLRLMVDLNTIDEDTRAASVGGSNKSPEYPFLSRETSDLLSNSQELMLSLERELKLQQDSYEEIYRRYEHNKKFFAHLPAIKPAEGHYSVNGFGMRIHPVLRVYRMHEGVDILCDVGTNVYASGDGVVHFAGRTEGGYGTVVEITHGFGYTTLYSHLSRILVRPGQKVKRGELIAKSGRSGLVSGPHLHYEVRLNGRRQNPVDYFFDDVDASRYRAQLASIR